MPAHSHGAQGATGGGQPSPVGNAWASGLKTGPSLYSSTSANNVQLNPSSTSNAGGHQAHNNMPPFLCLTIIIALQALFPPVDEAAVRPPERSGLKIRALTL